MRSGLVALGLLIVVATISGCGGNTNADDGGRNDAGSGSTDSGTVDSGTVDSGTVDSGTVGVDGALGGTDSDVDAGACVMPAATRTTPSPAMTFFVTSVGNGASGGNYGGLAGADARCQMLAAAVGAGARTWHAYLSVAMGTVLNARDRIGAGPWRNFNGEVVAAGVGALHAAWPPWRLHLDEHGSVCPMPEHDIFTGSDAMGMALTTNPDTGTAPPPTCNDWTSSSMNDVGWVGHENWDCPEALIPSWNSAHASTGCDLVSLMSTAGTGRLYCFAIN